MVTTPGNGVKPEWASLPPRRCDNCGARYKPKQPLREGQKYGFCKPECKKQFHKHGAAFIKLKDVVEKMVEKRMRELEKRFRDIVRQEITAWLANETVIPYPTPEEREGLKSLAAHRASR